MTGRIRIPLAVDAQLRIPLGPVQLPLRQCVALAIAVIPACVAFELPIDIGLRLAAVVGVVGLATMVATPSREGIWIGNWAALRVVDRWLSHSTSMGVPVVAPRAARYGWRRYVPVVAFPARLRALLDPPARVNINEGLLRLAPGGWRAVVSVTGPSCALGSVAYSRWCADVVRWLRSLDMPAQFLTGVGHISREEAMSAFDSTLDFASRGPLVQAEREFAGDIAVRSLAFTHHVVLAPRLAGAEGMPQRFGLMSDAPRQEAEHALALALAGARSAGLEVAATTEDKLRELLATSTLGDLPVAADAGSVAIGGQPAASVLVTRLGPDADWGMLVDVVQRSGMHGSVSLHLLPVSRAVIRRQLQRRRLWLRYAIREGRPDIDLEVSLQDTETLQADLAAGRVEGMRLAVSLRVVASDIVALSDITERLRSLLAGHGWSTERIATPWLAAASVGAPGCAPLRRGLLLTTDAVVSRLLPALGTPFAAVADPVVGLNLRTGASAYLSVFTRSNHNAVIVGSSGAGKSVAAKTMLIRHVMRGAGAVVLDPDSEYASVVQLLGGRHFELPGAALNPLDLGRRDAPDAAASRIVPVLSVMGGDETEYVGGRPIRRLPNEDKAWLHRAVASFLVEWRARVGAGDAGGGRDDDSGHRNTWDEGFVAHVNPEGSGPRDSAPLLSDFVRYLQSTVVRQASMSTRTRERVRQVALRLEGFTQGQLGQIFDRPSTFAIEPGEVIGVGFRSLSLAYAADLTPALCVVLSHVLDAIVTARSPMIVLVDEAHVLTADPDAGQVLEQLVRRARKCRAGVWMASQRIEEFTATALGRTLASTAATKVVLGVEDTIAAATREIFELAEDEASALTPPVPGRAALIAGGERTIVQIQPSPILWPFMQPLEIPPPTAANFECLELNGSRPGKALPRNPGFHEDGAPDPIVVAGSGDRGDAFEDAA